MKVKSIIKICIILVVLLALSSSMSFAASKSRIVKQGNNLYEKGNYATSIEKYKQAIEKEPESDIINFDVGTAYYKNSEYEKSIAHLQKALLSENEETKQRSYFNLGNSFYKKGISIEEKNIDAAISNLEKSLSSLDSAVNLDKEDKDAKYNYDFVKKELKRLKKKKKKEEKKKQEKKKDKEKKDQKTCPFPKKENGNSEKKDKAQQKKENSNKEKDKGEEKNKPQKNNDKENSNGKKEEAQQKEDTSSGDEKKQQQQGEQGQSSQSESEELTKQEAEMLLEKYKQSEEPKGLLNFYKGKRKTTQVLKDW